MAIKINDIPPEGLTVEFSAKLDLFDEGTASTAFTATLTIKPSGSGIFRVIGAVKAEPSLECSRCLRRFPFPIDEPGLNIELVPGSSLRAGVEHELDRSEMDVEFYEGDEIETLDLIKEQLLLAIPMVPLHDPDCRGLCSICGADLNVTECGCTREPVGETGPFSKLKDILNKKE
jgi:uncharacterized protein